MNPEKDKLDLGQILAESEEFRNTLKEVVHDALEDSGIRKEVYLLTKILEAIKYYQEGEYQKASDSYLHLRRIDDDEERKEIYMRSSQEALDKIDG